MKRKYTLSTPTHLFRDFKGREVVGWMRDKMFIDLFRTTRDFEHLIQGLDDAGVFRFSPTPYIDITWEYVG